MSQKYYRVYFDWSCTPETHWGEPCDDEVVIESYEDYEDGETYFDHESDEEKTITSPEDASEKLTSRYMGDAIDPFDFINFMDRKNPHNNGKDEFEDGFGDENCDTTKVEVYSDSSMKNLIGTIKLQ